MVWARVGVGGDGWRWWQARVVGGGCGPCGYSGWALVDVDTVSSGSLPLVDTCLDRV